MVRLFDEFLQINRVVTERRQGFALGSRICFFYFFGTVDEAHTFSTTTHRSFQHHRIADLVAKFYSFFYALQILLCTGNYRDSCFYHFYAGGNFISHRFHCFRIGADKDDAFFLASTGESGVFGKEAVTRMDSVGVTRFGHFDDFFYIQITLFGCCRSYTICFVCVEHVLRGPVCFGEDSNARYLHFPAGTHHPYGDFTAIGY